MESRNKGKGRKARERRKGGEKGVEDLMRDGEGKRRGRKEKGENGKGEGEGERREGERGGKSTGLRAYRKEKGK